MRTCKWALLFWPFWLLPCLQSQNRFFLWKSLRPRLSSVLLHKSDNEDLRPTKELTDLDPLPPPLHPPLQNFPPTPPPLSPSHLQPKQLVSRMACMTTNRVTVAAPSSRLKPGGHLHPRTCVALTPTACCRTTPSLRHVSTLQRGPRFQSESIVMFCASLCLFYTIGVVNSNLLPRTESIWARVLTLTNVPITLEPSGNIRVHLGRSTWLYATPPWGTSSSSWLTPAGTSEKSKHHVFQFLCDKINNQSSGSLSKYCACM